MIDGQKINLWVLHVLCSPTNYDRVRGAYSTKFYLARLRSKVQSAVKCENAKQFYEKKFLQGMWGPCVYDCLIQLFNSPAKTTIFTFLEVIFIHSIYSSSYPKKKQRKDPAKSEKKSLVRKKSWRIAYLCQIILRPSTVKTRESNDLILNWCISFSVYITWI